MTEQIHGANFCLIQSAHGLQCAKRKSILSDNDVFFGFQTLRDAHAARMKALFASVRQRYPEAKAVYVYGELFGGSYPHPEVDAVHGVQAVQTGVYYAPSIEFCAFDVAVFAQSETRYLDFAESLDLLTAVGFFCAEPLFIGSYQQAVEYSERFNSSIPRRLGLAELEHPNLAEGVIIKPMREIRVQVQKGSIRPILKKKIAEFAEDARFHGAQAWQAAPEMAYALDLLEWEMQGRVNKNRLASAVSKLGSHDDKAALKTLLFDDVWTDLSDAHADALQQISQEEKRLLELVLHDLITTLLERP